MLQLRMSDMFSAAPRRHGRNRKLHTAISLDSALVSSFYVCFCRTNYRRMVATRKICVPAWGRGFPGTNRTAFVENDSSRGNALTYLFLRDPRDYGSGLPVVPGKLQPRSHRVIFGPERNRPSRSETGMVFLQLAGKVPAELVA